MPEYLRAGLSHGQPSMAFTGSSYDPSHATQPLTFSYLDLVVLGATRASGNMIDNLSPRARLP